MPEKVAIMSDVHGNSPAFRAVLEDIRGAGCTRVFFLGDLVNGIDPSGCVELLRGHEEITCLKGNAENYVLTPDLDTLPQREEPEQVQLIKLIQWFRSHLREEDLAWLHALPELLLWHRACLVHDSPLDRVFPQRWYLPGIDAKYQEWFHHSAGITATMPTDELDNLVSFLASRGLSQVFSGHSHLPFYRKLGAVLICNAGSVGLPLDGDPRASWVMLDEMAGGEDVVTIRRVAYDIDLTLRLVEATPDYPDFEPVGRREAYKKMLVTGVHWSAYM